MTAQVPGASDSREDSAAPEETGDFRASIGVAVDPALLELALTHRSWAFEHGGAPHNERLEFLGDAILGQAVTVKLYRDYPDLDEGQLAKRRAALVSSVALAEVARRIELGAQVRLGVGEERTGGRNKDSILADTVEAVIGAVYLSTDPQTAAAFVLGLIEPLLDDPERFTVALDPKTTLQELAAARGLPHPQYDVTSEGPDHDRRFTARVELDGVLGSGVGTSKKAAELAAAREVVGKLQNRRASRKKRK